MASTGWTWQTIAVEMDLPKLAALNDYWKTHPPIHLLVAAFMGFKPSSNPPTQDENEAESIMALFPQ